MAVLHTTIILYILMSSCVGLSPPKKPPGKSHPTPRCNKNEHYVQNSTACEKTCANRDFMHLAGACKPISKCVCVGDLMRLNDDATGPCVTEDKCPTPGLNCGPYEVAAKEKIVCPPQTCESLFGSFYCPPTDPEPGCNCIDGYLRDSSGTCIPSDQCPTNPEEEPCPDGDRNATRQDCPSWCQPTCDQPIPGDICPAACLPRECVCKPGYILESRNDKCILPDDCPKANPVEEPCPDGDRNATRKDCPSFCQPTCDQPITGEFCPDACLPRGCVCKPGYILESRNGKCILPDDCPKANPVEEPCPDGDRNATRKDCPSFCQPTCDQPITGEFCPDACLPRECVCKPGYILESRNGKCILPDDCPTANPVEEPCPDGDRNATRQDCPSFCQRTCDQPITGEFCPAACLPRECVCKPGYILESRNGKCILPDDCPKDSTPECGANEVATNDRIICPPQTCQSLYIMYSCLEQDPVPGCDCVEGYLRNSSGICIPKEECPPLPELPECGENEVPTIDKIVCPPQTCDSLYRAYACIPRDPIAGCDCIDGYLRNASNICVPADQCPPPPSTDCGLNEEYSSEKITCPPQTCESIYTSYLCQQPPPPREAGCNCINGYLRNRSNICVPSEECPPPTPIPECGYNEMYTDRKFTCPPQSCDSLYLDYLCAAGEEPETGCICTDGHLRNASGVCVPIEECPPGPYIHIVCGPNEVETDEKRSCPPETCESIGRLYDCAEEEPTLGCKCIDGYYRDRNNECIPEDQCPIKHKPRSGTAESSASACATSYSRSEKSSASSSSHSFASSSSSSSRKTGPKGCKGDRNATYTDCTSKCPRSCGSPSNLACAAVCGPPGCQCKPGYVLSDGKCILPEDCPGCNGDRNATYTTCTSKCPRSCGSPSNLACAAVCGPPGCQCKPGYVLSDGKCILPEDCPGCNGDRNATYTTCTSKCPRSCGSPSNIVCAAVCGPPGCQCKPGYVLSNGKCIQPKDCPVVCDKNAVYQECPSICQPTCKQPEQNVPCPAVCGPDGCVCKPGYLLSDGKCVLPKDCPGGSPTCPANEQFVNCKVECPDSYCPVNDNRGILMCDPPYPCPSGCSCKAGFKRKSYEDRTCIEYSSCPPVNCTRKNEVWNPKPPNCIAERCADALNPQPCDKPYPNYIPQCVCKKGHYRNDSDICVPVEECPAQCAIPKQCRPTCAVPNPPNCPARSPASTNVNGCECQADYILSAVGGQCIRISECPQDQSCNGDPHARIKSCPWSCPATCDSPNASMCDKKCVPVGCECESGYLLSKDGKCILPDDCPSGNPCGPNGTFVDCGFRCPNQYCPQDDSRVQYACKPGRPCPPGCACKINYKRLSYENDVCIEAADCPPVDCTRPKEVWDPCPSDCLAEDCSNAYDRPTPCYTLLLNCQPKCVCEKNHFRNSSDICIPAKECNTPNPCTSDCAPTCANPNPPNCPSIPDEKKCCERGYIQLEKGGKCVRIEDCPKGIGCNGDPNAVPKQCPAACASTCDKPESLPCDKPCEEVGCECAPGYILSSAYGKCIEVNKCPGGNPCGPNAMFVGCKNSCPTDYCPVDDSRARIICETYPFAPCFSGCVCQWRYIRNDRKENKCIRPSDCPPVKCTRKNERWDRCPSACLAEGCQDVNNQPTTCNTLVEPVCQPRCICTKGTFRNSTDSCVPAAYCDI